MTIRRGFLRAAPCERDFDGQVGSDPRARNDAQEVKVVLCVVDDGKSGNKVNEGTESRRPPRPVGGNGPCIDGMECIHDKRQDENGESYVGLKGVHSTSSPSKNDKTAFL